MKEVKTENRSIKATLTAPFKTASHYALYGMCLYSTSSFAQQITGTPDDITNKIKGSATIFIGIVTACIAAVCTCLFAWNGYKYATGQCELKDFQRVIIGSLIAGVPSGIAAIFCF